MRKPKSVFVDVLGASQEFQILNVCEFNSTRKRMSTIVRGPDGKIKLYCKGADTVILERLAPSQPYTEKTLAHLEVCADHFHRSSTLSSIFRITQPSACGRSASPSVKYPNQSISSGRRSMTRQLLQSMAVARHWTRRPMSLRRTCSY